MAVVAERIVDGGVLQLIKQWLKALVIGEDEKGTRKTVGGGKANAKGTPQGGVLSHLLANCYRHILDRIWLRRNLKSKLQAHIVRYADDFVVLCKKDVEEPLKVVRHVLERLGFSLNETKITYCGCQASELRFSRFYDSLESAFKLTASLQTKANN
jgi:RNA-directed DNA polymerase